MRTSCSREGDCEQRADAAAYVLDALDEPDAYLEHLAECATCRAEVADFRSVVDALPATVPVVAAPRALRERILATIRSEAELLRAAGPQADAAPKASRRPAPILTTCVVIAAGIVIAAVIAFNTGSPASERVVSARVAATVSGAHASLRRVAGHAELVVSDMPQPPQGRIYEVWVNRGAGPRPTNALFSVTSRGSGSVNVPGSLHGVKEVMVTSEPFEGSSSPTGPPLLLMPLHA
jgi:hypothetical protein